MRIPVHTLVAGSLPCTSMTGIGPRNHRHSQSVYPTLTCESVLSNLFVYATSLMYVRWEPVNLEDPAQLPTVVDLN